MIPSRRNTWQSYYRGEHLDNKNIFEPLFWERLWQDAVAADKDRPRAQDTAKAWSRRAKSYDKNVESDSGQKRVEAALSFLDQNGVPGKGLRILDIGCGPGNFAIALAQRGHTVVALDPAEKMLQVLREKTANQPEIDARITTVLDDWIELDLDHYGWRKSFDLVFASMTPGVYDVATLKKAMDASCSHMYLSRFSGPRLMPLLHAVWQEIKGRDYHSQSLDVVFPLNWLYSMGYQPALKFHHWEREHTQTVDEAFAEIIEHLTLRLVVNTEVEGRVRAIVEQKAENGFITECKGATAGMLLWHVDKKRCSLGG
jgi:SAM-dependent methyltransferase